MKYTSLLKLQIAVNVIVAALGLFIYLGDAVNIKYWFEDPAAKMPANIVSILYDKAGQNIFIVLALVVFNVVMSAVVMYKLRGEVLHDKVMR